MTLDLNLIKEKTLALGGYAPSPSNKLLAFSLDLNGSEKYTIQFKVLDKTNKDDHPDVIADTTGDVIWLGDNEHVLYVSVDDTHRADKVWLHKIGEKKTQDRLLFVEKDGGFNVSVHKSMSGEYIFIESESKMTSEVNVMKADAPGPVKMLHQRQKGLLLSAEHLGDDFLLHHNLNAINFKISKVQTKFSHFPTEIWEDVFEDPLVYVTGLRPFKNHLIVTERSDALSRVRVFDAANSVLSKDSKSYVVNFEEEDYMTTVLPSHEQEFDSTHIKLRYNSYTTPPTTYTYNLLTRGKTVLKKEAPPSLDTSDYVTKRHMIPLEDVETPECSRELPITLVYKKSKFKGDGTNPGFLYGYGSYGICLDPRFSTGQPLFSLLDRGFVAAFAKVRGGADCGRAWYEKEGKFKKKKNTFNDFIRAAEWLVDSKHTSSDRLAIEGASAGGLLIGAAINQRPDLFKAYVAGVPFVDVINTMMDPTIPLTVEEYEEWGDPNDQEYFDYMATYSPYDNIRQARYPSGRVTAGLWDPRVQYWEPLKWVAKQRAEGVVGDGSEGSSTLIIDTLMSAGHFASSGRYDLIKDRVKNIAFIIDQCISKEESARSLEKL